MVYGVGRIEGKLVDSYRSPGNVSRQDRIYIACSGETSSFISCHVNGRTVDVGNSTVFSPYLGTTSQSFAFSDSTTKYYRRTSVAVIRGSLLEREPAVGYPGIWTQENKMTSGSFLQPSFNDEVFFVVKGFLVQKYLGDGTPDGSPVWDNSPPWCILDFLLNRASSPMEASQIDFAFFYAAAQVCTANNYEMNLVLVEQKKDTDILELMLTTCRGYMTYSAGKAQLNINTIWSHPELGDSTPAHYFDDASSSKTNDNIVEDSFSYYQNSVNDTPNRIIVKYIDQEIRENIALIVGALPTGDTTIPYGDLQGSFDSSGTIYISDEAITYTGNTGSSLTGCSARSKMYSSGYPMFQGTQTFPEMTAIYDDYDEQDRRVRVIEKKIDGSAVPTYKQAYDIAEWFGRESVEGNLYASLRGMVDSLSLTVGDVVAVTHDLPGWVDEEFRIITASESEDEEINYTLKLYNNAFYVGNESLPSVSLATTLQNPFGEQDPPTGLSLSSGTTHLLQGSDGSIISRIYVSWTAPADNYYRLGYFVEYKKSADSVWIRIPLIPEGDVSAYVVPVEDGVEYDVRVGATAINDITSDWASDSHAVVGKTAVPSDVTGLTAVTRDRGIFLSWNAISDADRGEYEIRYGASWAAGTLVDQVKATTYLHEMAVAGSYTYYVKAIDTSGNYSTNEASNGLVVSAPSQPVANYTINGGNLTLNWTASSGDYPIDRYEIRYGSTWSSGTFVDTLQARTYELKIGWSGLRSFMVRAHDAVGNESSEGGTGVTINLPGAPTITPEVIDNFALLKWSLAPGTLPIQHYEVRKGDVFSSADVLGTFGGTFATVFESAAGNYKYWVVGIDTADNYGTEASLSVYINQPPDYVLNTSWNSDFSGTKTNAFIEDGRLLVPVETAESYQDHFINNSWANPQDQIDAGYPRYIMPSEATAEYEEVFDYGTTLAATLVTANVTENSITGSVTMVVTISTSNTSSTGPWDDNVGVTQAYVTNFRWVKIMLAFTAADGDDLTYIDALNVTLDSKLKNDAGSDTITVAATGKVVTFNVPFIDVTSITVTANGTIAMIPVYDFTDIPNPTDFTAYLFNTSGTKITGDFSWTARGY
jgi:hypothetical protein